MFHQLKLLTITLPVFWAAAAYATDDSLSRRRVERIARASWQPFRPVSADEEIEPQADAVELMPIPAEGLPAETVIDGPIYQDAFINGCDGIGACNLPGSNCGFEGPIGCDSPGGCNDVTCFPCRRGRRIHIELPCTGWFQLDALAWWQRGGQMPPLATAAAPANFLFGNTTDLLDDSEFGGRIRFGFGIGRTGLWAIDAELLSKSELSEAASFTDGAGNVFASTLTSELEGASFHFMRGLACGKNCGPELLTCRRIPGFNRIAGIIGWRNLQLDESLLFSTQQFAAPASLFEDQFETDTVFNGVDLGFALHGERGRWTLDLLFKMALGNNRQRVTVAGQTTTAGVPAANGLLAVATNSGSFHRDRFAVVPELGANLSYRVARNWSLTAGYTFIYWSNVLRPGDQVDPDLNPITFPPVVAAQPELRLNETDFWTQGLNLGIRFDW